MLEGKRKRGAKSKLILSNIGISISLTVYARIATRKNGINLKKKSGPMWEYHLTQRNRTPENPPLFYLFAHQFTTDRLFVCSDKIIESLNKWG
jgi:hypothetical protein